MTRNCVVCLMSDVLGWWLQEWLSRWRQVRSFLLFVASWHLGEWSSIKLRELVNYSWTWIPYLWLFPQYLGKRVYCTDFRNWPFFASWSIYSVTISLLLECINDLPVIITLASWYLERNMLKFDASSLAIWLRISGIKLTFGLSN